MPVIPALWEAKVARSFESRVQDQPGQHGETPSLLEYKQVFGRGGMCLGSQLLRRLRQGNHLNLWLNPEVAGSWDCATAFQPGSRARLRLKKKRKEIEVEKMECSVAPFIWSSGFYEKTNVFVMEANLCWDCCSFAAESILADSLEVWTVWYFWRAIWLYVSKM